MATRAAAGRRSRQRQRLADVGALVQLVGEDALDLLDAGAAQLLQQRFGELVVGLGDDLAGVGVDHVAGQHAADAGSPRAR
jgi:hypothetical protein